MVHPLSHKSSSCNAPVDPSDQCVLQCVDPSLKELKDPEAPHSVRSSPDIRHSKTRSSPSTPHPPYLKDGNTL
jgi:hypothetical protein